MRSCELLVLVAVASGCGIDGERPTPPEDERCATSILTYENFGEPYMLNWCRGCHSSALVEGMRQGAPVQFNFEDLDTIRELAPALLLKATGETPTMPPAAGPSADERALLEEWLVCGAR